MTQNTQRDQASQRHLSLDDSSDPTDNEDSEVTDYDQPAKRPRRESS